MVGWFVNVHVVLDRPHAERDTGVNMTIRRSQRPRGVCAGRDTDSRLGCLHTELVSSDVVDDVFEDE